MRGMVYLFYSIDYVLILSIQISGRDSVNSTSRYILRDTYVTRCMCDEYIGYIIYYIRYVYVNGIGLTKIGIIYIKCDRYC